ncbi:MAG: succinate dehydrogenase, cytochrome b556 subunit [Alphaproteobacteria bacterium]|nr:MAG: succinate dehydrogenase, cytochrome b556 subunit [Alphaproteobacteria bacterium]PZO37840.1 MAG: succinate dehydrogenase, cytochrome b556 subunit [Alphaproteobacteria bacterium]
MSNAKDPSAVTTGHVMQPNGRPRPMSPHLQVWRWHVTMLASILTRVTGSALYVGAILVVVWIAALASGAEAYDTFVSLAGSPLGLLVWFGFTVSLLYHFAAGVRHLIWDAGAALTPKSADALSWGSIAFGVVASLAFWAYLFAAGRVSL